MYTEYVDLTGVLALYGAVNILTPKLLPAECAEVLAAEGL